MELNPEQKKQLTGWATQRDHLLNKIGALATELETKEKKNSELSITRTDIETSINKGLGRLAQIDEQEAERAKLLSKEISDLEKIKTTLQAEIPGLQKEIGGLKSEKNILTEVIETLKKVHSDVFDRASGLDKIVEHVTRVSDGNIADFKRFFEELKTTVQGIIDGNKKVIKETNIMVERVPKILREVTTPIRILRPVLNKKRLAAKGDIPK